MNFGQLAEITNTIQNNGQGYSWQDIPLTPGVDKGLWNELVNLRLRVDGEYVFWKSRGGVQITKTIAGNVLTAYPFSARLNGVLSDYIAIHTSMGNVQLWNVTLDTMNTIITGLPTSEKIQMIHRGLFLHAFSYDGGAAKVYDISKDVEFNWMDYELSYITGAEIEGGNIEEEQNVLGIEKGKRVIVFPNGVLTDPETGAVVLSSVDGAGAIIPDNYDVRSFLYKYNGGQYLIDENGVEHKQSQFFTFAKGDPPFKYTVGGSGVSFTINEYKIPLDSQGEPSFSSYTATVLRLHNSGGSNVVIHDTPDGGKDEAKIGGISETDAMNSNYVLPWSPDLQDYVDKPSRQMFSENNTSIIENPDYESPRLFRQYLVVDLLSDGSVAIPGKPRQVVADFKSIQVIGIKKIKLTIKAAGDNVEKRFLCASRWQPTSGRAFVPTSENYPNSPLFIAKEIDKNATEVTDDTPDNKLQRFINEILPASAGVSDVFGPGQLSPNSIARVSKGSLLLAGYTVNRPTPLFYTSPVSTTKGNIFIDITATTQLPNNMSLSFMYEYTDGKRSNIVDTSHFLQQGEVDDPETGTTAIGSLTITGPASSSEPAVAATAQTTLSVSGGTVSTGFTLWIGEQGGYGTTLAVSAGETASDIANNIVSLISGDANFTFTASHAGSGVLDFTYKTAGTAGNLEAVELREDGAGDLSGVDLGATPNPAGFSGGEEAVDGTEGTLSFTIGGVLELTYSVQYDDSKTTIANALASYLNTNSTDYEATVDASGGDPVINISALSAGDDGNGVLANSVNGTAVTFTTQNISGGTDPRKISANRIQIHSLNALVSKVYVLGKVVSDYHLIEEIEINEGKAHGEIIDLPNTEDELNDIETDIFSAPATQEVLEVLTLDNFIIIGAPFQELTISSQKEIVDKAKILRVIPLDFDTDKTLMRYRLAVFTDENIQFGYMTENTSKEGQFFDADFEVLHNNVVLQNRRGVSLIKDVIPFQGKNAVYFLAKNGEMQVALDINRFSVLANNEIVDTVFNAEENEYWFVCQGSNDIVVFDGDTGSFILFQISDYISIQGAVYAHNKLYLGMQNAFVEADVGGLFEDFPGEPTNGDIPCIATTNHIGSEEAKTVLKELLVAGQNFEVATDVDLQTGRKETGGATWSKSFVSGKNFPAKQIKMYGENYQLNCQAPMPRVRLSFNAVNGGFISTVRLKSNQTQNTGKARE